MRRTVESGPHLPLGQGEVGLHLAVRPVPGPSLPLVKGERAPLCGVPTGWLLKRPGRSPLARVAGRHVLAGRGARETLGWAPDEAHWPPFGKGARLFACEDRRTSCAFVVSPLLGAAETARRGGLTTIAHDVYAHCVVCHDSCPYGFQCMYMCKVYQYEYQPNF